MSEEKAVVKNEVAVSNVVEMQDGSKIDFGPKGKAISSYDVEAKTVTFKVVTGEVITFGIDTIPSEVLAEAVLYGLREKIKTTLSPIKPEDTAAKIQKEIASLLEGKFVTRSVETGSVELDDFMKAFALIGATGVVNTGNGTFQVPPSHVVLEELRPHWENVSDAAVINEVTAYWNSLDKKVKSKFRQNTFIKTQESIIESGAVAL
jgi:hypothetical protein